MSGWRNRVVLGMMLAGMVLAVPAFAAKKKPGDAAADPPAKAVTTADAAKAELSATLALANVRVSRVSVAEDPGLESERETVGPILEREESALKEGVKQLRAAKGDKGKMADAIKALDGADDEVAKYYKENGEVKERITKRNGIVNAEVGQIVRTPDGYVAMLQKVGLAGASLDKARTLVKDASKKAAATKSEGDSSEPVMDARKAVRAMLTAEQGKAVDGLLGAK